MKNLFSPLQEDARKILNRLPRLIDDVFPLPGRFRARLGQDVAELSRLLTSGREDRSASYLGKPALLSAYLRYFLPWNVYRLSRLLSCLPLELKPGDTVNDFGAGPLTLTASLWICRPELRAIPLEFRCLDRTALVMDAGKKFFAALSAAAPPAVAPSTAALPAAVRHGSCPWVIKTIRGEIKRNGRLSVEIKGKPAALSAAVNVYNELFWKLSPHDTDDIERFAEHQARLLSSQTDSSGSILVVEPGIPRSGEFISLLRAGLMQEGRMPLSPCVHLSTCPMSKSKWCHFAFDTEDAPEKLHKLSAAARLPKERAVLSFIFVGQEKTQDNKNHIRVISDSFPLEKPGAVKEQWGRYGCSKDGLVLVTGSWKALEASPSGALEELTVLKGAKDAKSGALLAEKKTSG